MPAMGFWGLIKIGPSKWSRLTTSQAYLKLSSHTFDTTHAAASSTSSSLTFSSLFTSILF